MISNSEKDKNNFNRMFSHLELGSPYLLQSSCFFSAVIKLAIAQKFDTIKSKI